MCHTWLVCSWCDIKIKGGDGRRGAVVSGDWWLCQFVWSCV